MKYTYIRNFIIMSVVLIGVVLALNICRIKRSLIYHPTQLPTLQMPQGLPLGVRYHRIKSALGSAELAVYAKQPVDGCDIVLVYSHGTAGCCEDILYMFEHSHPDWGLVLWDYQGYGRSGGEISEDNSVWDLDAVVGWTVDTMGVKRRDVVLWGRSLGTNVTLRYLDLVGSVNWPSCLILLTPFIRVSSVLEQRIGHRAALLLGRLVGDMEVVPILEAFCRKGGRALVLASKYDTVTPWAGALELQVKGQGKVELQEIYGSHQGMFERWENIFTFIQQHHPINANRSSDNSVGANGRMGRHHGTTQKHPYCDLDLHPGADCCCHGCGLLSAQTKIE